MILELDNGYQYSVPKEKRLLLFGANRIGKTLISKKLNKRYEELNCVSLLFNKDILSSDFIYKEDVENNKYIVTPFATEKKHIEEKIKKYAEKFNLENILKTIFSEKTSSAFSYFPDISKLYNCASSYKPYFYTEKFNYLKYYSIDFIKLCLKKKTGYLRFLDLINKMNEEGIFSKVSLIDDVFEGLTKEEYIVKEKIVSQNMEECPICYSEITLYNKNRIIYDLEKIILSNEIRDSFKYYVDLDDKFFDLITSFINNYEKNYNIFIKNMNDSIMFYLIDACDKNLMNDFNKVIEESKLLYIKANKFNIEQEKKNSIIYKKVESEFEKFNKITGFNFNFEIKAGSLEMVSADMSISNLSLSEQKLLQFIYFRILFLQNLRIYNKKIAIIIDDPFDSYDDIYVYNMIDVIFELVEVYSSKIKKFVVLSHSLNSLKMLNSEYIRKGASFKFYWLDIFSGNKEIINVNDKFNIMNKIDKNISGFALPTKLVEKMCDPYSLIVFSAILRENSQFNCFIVGKCNKTIKKSINYHRKYYDIISRCICHNKDNLTIEKLFKINNTVYGYNKCIFSYKTVNDVFEKMPLNYLDVELIKKKNNMVFKENDVINLFVWKYMNVLKIRRILEHKLWIKFGKAKYKILGDLISLYSEESIDSLYEFYIKYNNLFNSFNHSSTENIPPILIYHASYIYGALNEIIGM